MADVVLVVNAGSSSIKFSLFEAHPGAGPTALADGQLEGLGSAPRLLARDRSGEVLGDARWTTAEVPDHAEGLRRVGEFLRTRFAGAALLGVGHRVVHGGTRYAEPVRVTPEVLSALEAFVPLAPLHQPNNLAGIRAVARFDPQLPQVACFDTAFHRCQPKLAELFGLPREFYERGVRRYGFHGLSYEYVAGALPTRAPAIAAGRVVIAHLGSGASMCAVAGGRSVATSMGFTALEGLLMGTRTGSLDPGVVLHLLQEEGMSPAEVEDLLYKRSGLLGLSGVSNDMRVLLASPEPAAREAVEYFVYRAARELGSLAAALGGLDGLVFTAGIGEHSPEVRGRICARAAWLGLELDEAANLRGDPCITTAGSRVSAWVIPTDEELMIARHTFAALGS